MQDTYSRRNFLRLSAALLAGGAAVMTGAPERALGMGTISGRGEPGGLGPHLLCQGILFLLSGPLYLSGPGAQRHGGKFIGERTTAGPAAPCVPRGCPSSNSSTAPIV